MRFIFKTDYEQDIAWPSTAAMCSGTACCCWLVAAPWLLPSTTLAQLTFVLIYGIVGLGLMLLAGFTGLFSLGHAAFLGVGAYTEAVPGRNGLAVSAVAGPGGGAVGRGGRVVGLPALRVKGIYLGIATLAFGFIVEEVWRAGSR
jgi:branched-chain amino acid transport system permease protein